MARCNPGDPNFMGARIGVYPMHDDFADTLLKAIGDTNPEHLYVAVDDLGTTVQGAPSRVFEYAQELFLRAAAAAGHVTAVMQFSAGGEPMADEPAEAIRRRPMPEAKFNVAAHWALYPLGARDYSQVLQEEIAQAVEAHDVEASVLCYASRLDGSASAVFQTLQAAYKAVRARVPHTVIHATLSKGSPSKPKERIDVYGGEHR